MVNKNKCPLCSTWRFISTNLSDSLCSKCRDRLVRNKDPIIAYLLLELRFVKTKIAQIEKITGLAIGDKAIVRRIQRKLEAKHLRSQKRTEQAQGDDKIKPEGKDIPPQPEKGPNQ